MRSNKTWFLTGLIVSSFLAFIPLSAQSALGVEDIFGKFRIESYQAQTPAGGLFAELLVFESSSIDQFYEGLNSETVPGRFQAALVLRTEGSAPSVFLGQTLGESAAHFRVIHQLREEVGSGELVRQFFLGERAVRVWGDVSFEVSEADFQKVEAEYIYPRRTFFGRAQWGEDLMDVLIEFVEIPAGTERIRVGRFSPSFAYKSTALKRGEALGFSIQSFASSFMYARATAFDVLDESDWAGDFTLDLSPDWIARVLYDTDANVMADIFSYTDFQLDEGSLAKLRKNAKRVESEALDYMRRSEGFPTERDLQDFFHAGNLIFGDWANAAQINCPGPKALNIPFAVIEKTAAEEDRAEAATFVANGGTWDALQNRATNLSDFNIELIPHPKTPHMTARWIRSGREFEISMKAVRADKLEIE